jgi:hypothetical protein
MKSTTPMHSLVLFLSAAILLIFSAATKAVEPPPPAPPAQPARPATPVHPGETPRQPKDTDPYASSMSNQRMSGTIRSINTVDGIVTVRDNFDNRTFHVDPNMLQGLKAGDRVNVTYSSEGNVYTVSQILRSGTSGDGQKQPSSPPATGSQPSPTAEPSGTNQAPSSSQSNPNPPPSPSSQP